MFKEVVGPEPEAHAIPCSHRVGNVLSMWDVQETRCHPGHQILEGEEEEGQESDFAEDTNGSSVALTSLSVFSWNDFRLHLCRHPSRPQSTESIS